MVGSDITEPKDLEPSHFDKTGLGYFILDNRGGSIFIEFEHWDNFKKGILKSNF